MSCPNQFSLVSPGISHSSEQRLGRRLGKGRWVEAGERGRTGHHKESGRGRCTEFLGTTSPFFLLSVPIPSPSPSPSPASLGFCTKAIALSVSSIHRVLVLITAANRADNVDSDLGQSVSMGLY